mgnify:FL=1
MTRILLTGRRGQVGFELQRALAPLGRVTALDRHECDLSDPEAIRAMVRDVQPDIIVNPAAYTAVDKAESESELAASVNAIAPAVLGEEARKLGALVIHYSTDYVFDGLQHAPYKESDTPNPQSVYGRTKLAGELALAASGADHLILRTSWVVGAHGGNFAKTILRLAAERESLNVVADQHGAPTSAALLADVTAQLLGRYLQAGSDLPLGLYHLAAGGETHWQAYASHVVQRALDAGLGLKLRPEAIFPIATAEYPTAAKRPPNSRLDTHKLRETFGLHLPDWQIGLDHILEQILKP